jgi:hypothetical protein
LKFVQVQNAKTQEFGTQTRGNLSKRKHPRI